MNLYIKVWIVSLIGEKHIYISTIKKRPNGVKWRVGRGTEQTRLEF